MIAEESITIAESPPFIVSENLIRIPFVDIREGAAAVGNLHNRLEYILTASRSFETLPFFPQGVGYGSGNAFARHSGELSGEPFCFFVLDIDRHG